jgi:hypothetical protein
MANENTWDYLVGSQTEHDFMAYSVEHDAPFSKKEIEDAVSSYVDEIPTMFKENFAEREWTEDDEREAYSNLYDQIIDACKRDGEFA